MFLQERETENLTVYRGPGLYSSKLVYIFGKKKCFAIKCLLMKVYVAVSRK